MKQTKTNKQNQDGDSVNIADGVDHFDLPRLTLTLRPAQASGAELEDDAGDGAGGGGDDDDDADDADVMNMSTGEALLGLTAQRPSPFSKKRRIHKGQNHKDEGAATALYWVRLG